MFLQNFIKWFMRYRSVKNKKPRDSNKSAKYQTMVAVRRSRWLVSGVIGGSPSMMLTSMMLAKHMSIVENQLARGCFRDNT